MDFVSISRARLSRLLTQVVPVALLFLLATSAQAATFFVDIDGGSDTAFDGTSATIQGGQVGPFQTINRALTSAGNNDTIVILAGTYAESFTVTESGLTISSQPEGGDARVRLMGSIVVNGLTAAAPASVRLTSTSSASINGIFTLNSPLVDLQNGSLDFGSNITTIGDGAEVTLERTSGAFTGTPVFASTPNLTYNGAESVTAGSEMAPARIFAGSAVNVDPTITVALTGGTVAAPRTLTLAASSPLTLGNDVIVNVATANAIVGSITVSGGGVFFTGPGRYGSVTVVSGGTLAAITTDLSFNNLAITGTGSVVAGARTITLFGNFSQESTSSFASGSLAFDGTGSYTFTPRGNFQVRDLAIGVGADTNPTVLFNADATVSGAFLVAPTATANLNGNLLNVSAGGRSDVDGTVTNGAVAFQGAGSTIDGLGTYDQILVLGDDVTTVAGSNFQFTGQLLLSGGGLINTAAADVSPSGPNAIVFVLISVANGGGDNRIVGGRFNGRDQLFNLTYQGTNANYTVGSEFDTEFINNLVANASGLINAAGVFMTGPVNGGADSINGTVTLTSPSRSTTTATTALEVRFPNYSVDIDGTLTVGDDVLLTVAPTTGAGTFTGDLTLLATGNSVQGTISGPGRLVLGSGIAGAVGNAPSIIGSGIDNNASTASTISTAAGILIAANANAVITGIELIGTSITDGSTSAARTSTLTLGLARDNTGGAASNTGAGNVTGAVSLNGGLTLTSAVEFLRNLTLNGAVALGTNDIVFNAATSGGEGSMIAGILTLNGQTVTGATGQFRFVALSTFDPRLATVPGVDVIASTSLISRVTVANTFRIAADFNADTASDSDGTGSPSPGDDFLTLGVVGSPTPTIILANNGRVIDNAPFADREVVFAGFYNFINQESGVFSTFALFVLGSPTPGTLQAFTSSPEGGGLQSLPEVGVGGQGQATFEIVTFTQTAGRFNLAGHNVNVSGDVFFVGAAPIVNLQDETAANEMETTPTGNVARGSVANPFSEFRFTGAANSQLNFARPVIDPNSVVPGFYVGSGVDFVLRKAAQTAIVELTGGALLFDDQFTPPINQAAFVLDTPNDETFFLEQGIFAAGTQANRNTIYVNLDHENTTAARTAEATTDNGQGFAFRGVSFPNPLPLPLAQIAGTIQKRIISDPTTRDGNGNLAPTSPGRVVNPLGDRAGEYAEFVLDFESIERAQTFGRRTIRTTFTAQSPGGQLGLPIRDGVRSGIDVGSTGNFAWLVTSDPTLGADTEFNVEARYDGYTLGSNESVADLRLVRRQFGDETTNPFTLVSTSYDNFLTDATATNGGNEPTVVAKNAQALLGLQGTLFAYGLRAVAPTTPTDVARFQVINNAVSGGPVDVYAGNVLIADNLAFGQATAYQTVTGVTGTAQVTITIAPETSTSPTGGRAFSPVVAQGVSYAVLVLDDGADATPGNAYDAQIITTSQTTARTSDTVDVIAANASRDAGRLDIGITASTAAFRDLAFGTSAATAIAVDPAPIRFSAFQTGAATRFYTGTLDLTAARGERGILIARGVRTPIAGQESRNFRFVFVRPTGEVIIDRNTTDTAAPTAAPTEFALRGTAPNPFRTTTNVRFDLPEAAEVQVEVYDALGRRVMQTAPSAMAAGADQAVALDGNGLAAGLYVYRLSARGESQTWTKTGQITVLR